MAVFAVFAVAVAVAVVVVVVVVAAVAAVAVTVFSLSSGPKLGLEVTQPACKRQLVKINSNATRNQKHFTISQARRWQQQKPRRLADECQNKTTTTSKQPNNQKQPSQPFSLSAVSQGRASIQNKNARNEAVNDFEAKFQGHALSLTVCSFTNDRVSNSCQ